MLSISSGLPLANHTVVLSRSLILAVMYNFQSTLELHIVEGSEGCDGRASRKCKVWRFDNSCGYF